MNHETLPAQGPVDVSVGRDILERLFVAQSGSCSCMTKTPYPQYHDAKCLYRLLNDAAGAIDALRAKAARWDAMETLMILGDVDLTQAEDGGYCIAVEPVESIMATAWEGDTPDQAADKVVAQLTPPNALAQADAACGVSPGAMGSAAG